MKFAYVRKVPARFLNSRFQYTSQAVKRYTSNYSIFFDSRDFGTFLVQCLGRWSQLKPGQFPISPIPFQFQGHPSPLPEIGGGEVRLDSNLLLCFSAVVIRLQTTRLHHATDTDKSLCFLKRAGVKSRRTVVKGLLLYCRTKIGAAHFTKLGNHKQLSLSILLKSES